MLRELADMTWTAAEKIVLVMDNLNRHKLAVLSHPGTVSDSPLCRGPRSSKNGTAFSAHTLGET